MYSFIFIFYSYTRILSDCGIEYERTEMRIPTEEEYGTSSSSSSSSSFRRHPSTAEMSEAEEIATPEENEAASTSSSSFRHRPSAVALCAAEGMATPEENKASAPKRIRGWSSRRCEGCDGRSEWRSRRREG